MRQLALCLALLTTPTTALIAQAAYHGRTGDRAVRIPRLDGTLTVDGNFDEPDAILPARATDPSPRNRKAHRRNRGTQGL